MDLRLLGFEAGDLFAEVVSLHSIVAGFRRAMAEATQLAPPAPGTDRKVF